MFEGVQRTTGKKTTMYLLWIITTFNGLSKHCFNIENQMSICHRVNVNLITEVKISQKF